MQAWCLGLGGWDVWRSGILGAAWGFGCVGVWGFGGLGVLGVWGLGGVGVWGFGGLGVWHLRLSQHARVLFLRRREHESAAGRL